jgi:hypothetical protein
LTAKRLGKRFLKISGIILGSMIILLTAFHFWIVRHAEDILQNLVTSKSNGTLKLEVKNFRFNWFSKKMELDNAVFYTTDSSTAGTTYRFAVKKIKLKVKALLPIIFEKKVMISDLDLKDPDITVTRLRNSTDTARGTKVSIPGEMGRIYNSIQDALQVLKVKKFEIENAKFTLVNKIDPDQLPVTISHIDFHIDNLKIDTSELTGKEKILFSDNVVLKARDQDILFPDGRHRISFRKFRVNIEKKIVEFDSCTIAAIKTDSSDAAFSVYFDALLLTNIDFDTLYRSEVIKADSVYCINPKFKLDIQLGKKTGPRKPPPKLDQIIRQLTGDLALNFVVVNNASFDINTVRDGNPSSFTSEGNNFEMQGLSVDNDAARPLKVKKFALSIRNYENFLRDSTYEMRFDSVMFNDNQILLNSFSFRQFYRGKTVNSFSVPRFLLTGLSWDDLLFEQKLTAQQATLYDPTIDYIETGVNPAAKKDKNIFDALSRINNVIMLEDLHITNGNIKLQLAGDVEMKLDHATFSVESRALLGSDQLSEIRRSVNHLDFKKGTFRIKDLNVQLDNIFYTGNDSRLKAGTVHVSNNARTIDAKATGVTMDEIFINEKTGDISIGAANWDQADIHVMEFRSKSNKSGNSFINLTDINGKDTRLEISFSNKKTFAYLNRVSAAAFLMKPGENPIISGLRMEGKDLLISDSVSRTSVTRFTLNDLENAHLENTRYHRYAGADSVNMLFPRINFVPNIQSAIDGKITTADMSIVKPVLNIHLAEKTGTADRNNLHLPKISINKLFIDQPLVNFSGPGAKGNTQLIWNGNLNSTNSILLQDITSEADQLRVRQLDMSLDNFQYRQPGGKGFETGKGEIKARLNNMEFRQAAAEPPQWNVLVSSFEGKDFLFDSLGKKAGRFAIASLAIKDMEINSFSVSDLKKMIGDNKRFQVQRFTGEYSNQANLFKWFNAGYDRRQKVFSLDSFSYRPVMDKDSFVATHPYQTDYIQLKTGAMKAGPFDIDLYLKDSIIKAGQVRVDDLRFTDFRDNRPPFATGFIKPLMVTRLKSIPIKISIDSLYFENANAVYTELNPKTNQAGAIPVTRMTLRMFPVRNYDLSPTDSLRIQVNGYLMDSIWIRLRLRESYHDSLSGFLMTARIKPTDLRLLNPAIGPLASVQLKSGYLDTLSMRVAGNEYLAYGQMEMLYHDLKVQLLKKGEAKKAGFLSFLLNTLIKNQNRKRSTQVFFIRNRERSALNYLVKILLNGVNSTVGAKSNRKILRKYKKELRQRNLPPVDYD